jgi:hypothetical protein
MAPSRITRMTSASRMVESRCAMTKLVRSVRSADIACCTSSSVRVSTELVASSRISSAGFARKARAMVMSCFSPALRLPASASSTVSYPSGSECTNRSTYVAVAAATTSSRVAPGFP